MTSGVVLMQPEPIKLCECGCGQATPFAARSRASAGWIKGKPLRFIHGHSGRPEIASPITRFWPKVRKTDTCWVWQASVDVGGYGKFYDGERWGSAHRWSYEHFVGPIPEGLTLDHLCRNRACVNPEHLEPVTQAENSQRGYAGFHNSLKTHCPHGHEYTPENIHWKYTNGVGQRQCRTCRAAKSRVAYERKKAV